MINWIGLATNTTGRYCLRKIQTCRITLSLIQHVLKCLPSARTQARRCWRHSPTARSMTAWRRTAHWLLMRRFSSSTLRFWYDRLASKAHFTQCSQPDDSRFSMTYRNNIFWVNAWATQYEFTVVNCQNTISAFHKVVQQQCEGEVGKSIVVCVKYLHDVAWQKLLKSANVSRSY